MLVLRAYRFRLYPTREQQTLLERTFGCKRFTWNKMLEERETYYAGHGKSIGKARKTEKEWKEIHQFLKQVDSIALQQARIDLDKAYAAFFQNVKDRKAGLTTRRVGKPRFKFKRGKQAYRTMRVGNNVKIDFPRKELTLPKVGAIRYRDGRTFGERMHNVTVSRTKSGKYHASILVEQDLPVPEVPVKEIDAGRVAGLDASAASLAVTDAGRELGNKKCYRREENRLKRLHRRLSRKKKGSRNRDKARVRLSRLYDKIGNRRSDHQHKLALHLARDFEAVCIEDLNIEGIKQLGKGHAKTFTLDFAWGQFSRLLDYKLAWRGKELVKVGRFYPSSKTCSACGSKNDALKLADRGWTCPSCGSFHDRDINAATNIKREGLRLLQEGGFTITNHRTVGTTGSHAREDRVRPAAMPAPVDEPGIHVL